MSEEQKDFKEGAQAWLSIWIDAEGGLSFEGSSVSTTQLLGMVSMAKQIIMQRALNGQAAAES